MRGIHTTPLTRTPLNKPSTSTAHFDIETQPTDVETTTMKHHRIALYPQSSLAMTVPAKCNGRQISVFMDTGACPNIINIGTLRALHDAKTTLVLEPPCLKLSGLDDTSFKVVGHTPLSIQLANSLSPITATFHVCHGLNIPGDILLGLQSMREHCLSLAPAEDCVYQHETPIRTLTAPKPLLCTSPSADGEYTHLSSVAQRSLVDTSSPAVHVIKEQSASSSNTLPPSPSSSSSQEHLRVHGVLANDVTLEGRGSAMLQMRLAGISDECEAICMSESLKMNAMTMEDALCKVDKNGQTFLIMHNSSPYVRKFRQGTCVVDFEVLPERIGSVQESEIISPSEILRSDHHKQKVNDYLATHLEDLAFPEAREKLHNLLETYHSIVSLPDDPIGSTNVLTHSIPVDPNTNPIYVPAYRTPHSQRAILDTAVKDMLASGIIEHTTSPWNFPIFLVKKKNGQFRPVVDYRKLNAVSHPQRYPLPHLQDILSSMGTNNKVFTTLDLASGYWQVDLDEHSKPLTAFSTPSGHWQFRKLPFGVSGAPLTFQRLVNKVLHGLLGKQVFAFIDDIIIVSQDVDSHITLLQEVFDRLYQAGLTLRFPKCHFLRPSITYLGHVLDQNGVHTTPDKVKAIFNYPVPTDVKSVRSFLGLSGYYRSFIKDYSRIARPLTQLLRKDSTFTWGAEHQEAFDSLRTTLTSPPVLAYPDHTKDFFLYTDACGKGLGAALMQYDVRNKLQPLAYASRTLNKAESNYSTTHLEALAVVWALRHFRDIIYGYNIHVRTDHAAVVELFNTKTLTGKLARWGLIVQDFNPSFAHVPGAVNQVADALSRNIGAIMDMDVDHFDDPSRTHDPTLNDSIRAAQQTDNFCQPILYYLQSGDPNSLPTLPVPLTDFDLNDGILVRNTYITTKYGPHREVTQIVVPESLVSMILHNIHSSPHAGHPGKSRALMQARLLYYWPRMRLDIIDYINNCHTCAENYGSITQQVPIKSYPIPLEPWDTIAIDLLKLPQTTEGHKYLLVAIDHFSRFSVLVPIVDKQATTVAKALIDEVFCKYNTPKVLISDNGTEFNNKILEAICKEYQVDKVNTMAYHPASNGMVERQNRKIIQTLRSLVGDVSVTWHEWMPQVMASLNSSLHKSIGDTPHFVIFGQDHRLPYSFLLKEDTPIYNFDDYVRVRGTDFQKIYKRVTSNIEDSKAAMNASQWKSATDKLLVTGDIVYLKIQEPKNKLAPRFEGPYRVLSYDKGNKVKIRHLTTLETKLAHLDHLKRTNRPSSSTCEASTPAPDDPLTTPTSTPGPAEVDTTNDYRKKLRSYTSAH